MKKEELKKVLKPLIKECIKEVIFEDGTLSSIIKEVVTGTSQLPPTEAKNTKSQTTSINNRSRNRSDTNKLYERKKKLLGAIGADAYNGVNVFEGLTPPPKAGNNSPLSDQDSSDPGVDITSLMRPTSEWKKLAGN